MRIAIVTTGRFHVLDLARELSKLGHHVEFYSFVPRGRAEKFGLPSRCHRNLLPYVAPLVAAQRYGPKRFIRGWLDEKLLWTMDSLVASILEPCNVFIGMSGLCVKSAEAAKRKYGAKVFIERGSRHILSQKEILDAIRAPAGRKTTVPDYAVRRELASYEIADIIVVPSRHAKRSFIERGVTLEKLFRNPYGVDLSMFPPTPAPSPDPPTVIYVGSWSLRKGCDVLTEAWQKLKGVKLIHVGPYGDEPIPRESGFQHYGPVDQERLADFYAKAHVFAIASREEGLSLVQAQALACGLPVVCTDRTGGEDLSEFLDDPSSITVVSIEDSDSLANAIHESLDRACRMNGVRDLLGQAREKLSWRAYGERYDRALQMCNQPVR